MSQSGQVYTVQEMARLAGVTVRTLHYYDQIGLLEPAARNEAGYRLYSREELLRLQQILFFREMDVPLADIKTILTDPEFDGLDTLRRHRQVLRTRAGRLSRLIQTAERTIAEMEGGSHMVADKELYDGFTPEEAELYRDEARQRWPSEFAGVEGRLRAMGKESWKTVQKEGEEIATELAQIVGDDPASDEAQRLVKRHHSWIENFYPADADRYRGLAEMYIADERFAAYYDAFAPGLAKFLSQAMQQYAASQLE
jgi:DNA-binding transcriptional MerR regulator